LSQQKIIEIKNAKDFIFLFSIFTEIQDLSCFLIYVFFIDFSK